MVILAAIWLVGYSLPIFNLVSDVGCSVCIGPVAILPGNFKVHVTVLLLYFNFGSDSECFHQFRIGKGKLFG